MDSLCRCHCELLDSVVGVMADYSNAVWLFDLCEVENSSGSLPEQEVTQSRLSTGGRNISEQG